MSVDLKTLTPDTSLPTTGFLFGADSQASSTPSVYGTAAVATAVGLQFPAGAQATPSISTTGDNDTGIWFPAANTVAVSTNATERMRIDSSGNVGIGTSSPTVPLVVKSEAAGNIGLRILEAGGVAGAIQFTNDPVSAERGSLIATASGNMRMYGTSTAEFYTASTERMRIDSSGNVGIGTSSPGGRLEVTGAGSSIVDARLRISNPNTSSFSTAVFDLYSNGRTRVEIYGQQDGTGNGGFLIINTSDAAGALQERMRIDASGNVGIRTSSFGTSAAGVIGIANGTAPTTSPAGMGQLYVEGGALKYRGSSGTVTTIANA